MNKAGFLVLSAVMSTGSFLFIQTGCGSEAEGGSGGTGGSGSSSTSSSKASTGSGSSSSGGLKAATCDQYCKDIAANCKDMATQQYPNDASCKAFCATFEAGTPAADPSTQKGNTLECRAYHTSAAAKDAMSPATHCHHAGPTGGDLDPVAGMATDGPCGDGVAAFCKAAIATCGTTTWADVGACTTAMAGVPKTKANYSVADTANKDFGCFVYHLSVAAGGDAMAKELHCKHINPAAMGADAKCITP